MLHVPRFHDHIYRRHNAIHSSMATTSSGRHLDSEKIGVIKSLEDVEVSVNNDLTIKDPRVLSMAKKKAIDPSKLVTVKLEAGT